MFIWDIWGILQPQGYRLNGLQPQHVSKTTNYSGNISFGWESNHYPESDEELDKKN
jgi:hypothetical protein